MTKQGLHRIDKRLKTGKWVKLAVEAKGRSIGEVLNNRSRHSAACVILEDNSRICRVFEELKANKYSQVGL